MICEILAKSEFEILVFSSALCSRRNWKF